MDLILARALHVVSVLVWIGGVGFVTTTLFPVIRRSNAPAERLATFIRFEDRFAPQARLWVGLAGISGLYLLIRSDLWVLFASPHYWWMHAMVCLWTVFAVALFVLEPLVVHARIKAAAASPAASAIFARMERLHQILFAIALITVLGAVSGSHGA